MKRTAALICFIGVMIIFLCAGFFRNYVSAGEEAPKNNYTGPNTCKMCHFKNHKSWENSKMARTFSRLNDDDKKNSSCLSCHTTGFGKGGYDLNKSADENKKFEGVSCEACHGPGNEHVKAPKDKKKSMIISGKAIDCVSCHRIHAPHPETSKI